MKPERVAIYARVSTVAGQSPEMQLCELREYAARRVWQVVGEYVEHASGARESRPALNRLMTDARRRKFYLEGRPLRRPQRHPNQSSIPTD